MLNHQKSNKMELIANPNPKQMIHLNAEVMNSKSSSFIEANTTAVSLEHLKDDCIIPVFSKDNESTISHYQFVDTLYKQVQARYPDYIIKEPEIRVSHVIKGRIPSAIGKPAKELQEDEKTIYYERCAFLIHLLQMKKTINGNELSLSIGGVRSLSQENLYSKKSLEKFKVFIGFKNKVCTNLCVSTDGIADDIRIGSINELEQHTDQLFLSYNEESHLENMERMGRFKLSEKQFAHFIGKARMYQHLDKREKQEVFPFTLNDSQINTVVKDYYNDRYFKRDKDGSINLWKLYNLFTGANKSSYIDNLLDRNVNAYELVNELSISIENNTRNWFLQ